MDPFWKTRERLKAVNYLHKKSYFVDVRVSSNYTSGPYQTSMMKIKNSV